MNFLQTQETGIQIILGDICYPTAMIYRAILNLVSKPFTVILNALHKKPLVSSAHVYDTAFLWNFGRLINNTDMHLENLSFGIENNIFRLLPVYDMCSMGFAPKSGGEVLPYDFSPSDIRFLNVEEKTLVSAKNIARDFWNRVINDDRISDELREYLNRGNPIDLMESD